MTLFTHLFNHLFIIETMKKILIFIIVLITGIAYAQSDKEAAKLLEDVINQTSSYNNFKANLSYTMVNIEMDIDEKKTGIIYVQGDSYRIKMEGQVIISDGVTIWTYIKDSEEVMVSNVDNSEESISPTQMLTKYNEGYHAKFDKDKKDENSPLKEITLKPIDKNNFEKMSVIVNANKLSLENFSVYDVNGNVFTYHIVDLQPNIDLPADTFTFDYAEYPGVDVIDMR